MKTTSTLANVVTVGASIAAACAATVSIAGAASVTVAPVLRQPTSQVEIVRLDPVVVTISKAAFESVRDAQRAATELARANATATRRG